jgi:hypothetical protein
MGNRFRLVAAMPAVRNSPRAGRRLIFAGTGQLQEGDTERSICGRRFLSLSGEKRKAAIRRIDNLRSTRAHPLGRTERRAIIGPLISRSVAKRLSVAPKRPFLGRPFWKIILAACRTWRII